MSALPKHWVDNETLWYPPSNGSEKPTQVVNKATWRQYPIREVYWDTVTKKRSQAQADADVKCRKERIEGGTSTDSDVPQQRVKAKIDVMAKQPPSAPASKTLGYSRKIDVVAKHPPSAPPCNTLGKGRKRQLSNSATDSESESQPVRKSPRKHQVTDISLPTAKTTQGPSAQEPKKRTAQSTSVSQPPITSPARSIEDFSLGDLLISPTAESMPRTAMLVLHF